MKTICNLSSSLFLAFLLGFAPLAAQTPLSYVPADAGFVLTADFDHLGNKVTMKDLRNIDFVEHFLNEELLSEPGKEGEMIRHLLNDPATLGLDISQPLCFFASPQGHLVYFNVLVKLSSREAFEKTVFQVLKRSGDTLVENGACQMLIKADNEQSIAWNGNILAWSFMVDFSPFMPATTLDGDEELIGPEEKKSIERPTQIPELPTEEIPQEPNEYENPAYDPVAEQRAIKAQNQSRLVNWVDKLLNQKQLLPLSSVENFRKATAEPSDVHFWMNYRKFMQFYDSFYSNSMDLLDHDVQQFLQFLMPATELFYNDTYVSLSGNLKNGLMELNSKVFYNEDIASFYKKALDAKFNKRMLRYVKGDEDLFGYFFINMNIKNSIDEGKKLLYKVLDNTPEYGQVAKDAVKILGIVIDEEAIGNVLKGDLMLAVSGLQATPVTTKTYKYDEDFNMIAKDSTIMLDLPVVTLLMSYGSKNDLMKFINLGVHSQVLQDEGRYWSFTLPNLEIKFFLALENGLLIMTNDQQLVQQRLATGYAKSQRLGKKHRKALCKSGSSMYFDISHTLRAIAITEEMRRSPSGQSALERLASEINSMEVYSDKYKGSSMDGQVHLHLFDESENFLIKVLQLINEFYLENAGGART